MTARVGMRIGAVEHAREQERAGRRQRVGRVARARRASWPRRDSASSGSSAPARSTTGASDAELVGRDQRLLRARGQRAERRVGANGTGRVTDFDEHERERVQVGATVELHALRLLGRRVARGAEHRARRLGPARLGERARETEVGDAHDAVLVEQQVRGLDVAVQHAAGVRVLERRRDVAADARRLRDR